MDLRVLKPIAQGIFTPLIQPFSNVAELNCNIFRSEGISCWVCIPGNDACDEYDVGDAT
jgi:hypothetical protein